jgi:hypothetical protein
MFFNWLLFPTLFLGMALYWLGHRLGARPLEPRARAACIAAASVLCLPGLSFLLYYLHLIREPVWYVESRSLPGVEMLSAFWGLVFGIMEIRRPLVGIWRYLAGDRMMLRLSLLLMFVPFAKPILLPFINTRFNDAWKDGVCLQSTPATCGPCSLATISKHFGIEMKERDIARGSFSGMTGTENWYLIRYARRHGLEARVRHAAKLADVNPPAIIGVKLDGGAGHFITYLGEEGRRHVIGDPLSGRFLFTDDVFRSLYAFSGTAMEFSAKTN